MAIPSGCEAAVHALSALHHQREDIWTLTIDYKNAFNTASRTEVLKEIRATVPELSVYAEFCYGSATHPPRLYHDANPPIESKAGVQQGDPLGPLGFALGLQPLIEEISRRVPGLTFQAWYLDAVSYTHLTLPTILLV